MLGDGLGSLDPNLLSHPSCPAPYSLSFHSPTLKKVFPAQLRPPHSSLLPQLFLHHILCKMRDRESVKQRTHSLGYGRVAKDILGLQSLHDLSQGPTAPDPHASGACERKPSWESMALHVHLTSSLHTSFFSQEPSSLTPLSPQRRRAS